MDKIKKVLGFKRESDVPRLGFKRESDVPRFFFRVRPFQPNDGDALRDLFQQNLPAAGNLTAETFLPLPNLGKVAKRLERAGHIKMVAEACKASNDEEADALEKLSQTAPSLSHRLLGYAVLAPYRNNPGYQRTAGVAVLLLPLHLIAADDFKAIIAALIGGCARACKERDLNWRVFVSQVPFREDHTPWQEYLAGYQEAGFQKVGELKDVLEAEGKLSSLIVLQRNL